MRVTRSKLVLGVLLCVSCGPKIEGGVNAIVDFVRVDTGRACIRVAVVDHRGLSWVCTSP